MRTPNLGSVFFAPQDPSSIRDVAGLIRYIRDLELRTSAAINALAAGHLDKVFAAPDKPRGGDIRYADGTEWDPGGGEGIYYYNDDASSWIQLG